MKNFAFIVSFLLILSYMTPVFSQNKKELAVVSSEIVAPEVNVVENKLHLRNAPVGKRVQIITIIGNKVRDMEIKSSEIEIDLSNLPKAVYIVKLEGVVKKFVIK